MFKGVQGACSAEDRVQGRVVESNGRHEGAYLGKDKRLLEHLEVGSLAGAIGTCEQSQLALREF